MKLSDTLLAELGTLQEEGRAIIAARRLGARAAIRQVLLAQIPQAAAVVQRLAVTGQEKKAALLAWLDSYYNAVIRPIDLPGPDAVFDPLLKEFLLSSASVVIDVFCGFARSEVAPAIVALFQPPAFTAS